MRYGRTYRAKRSKLPFVVLLIVAIAGYYSFAGSTSLSPKNSFIEASNKEAGDAYSLLSKAESDSLLRPWAALNKAKLLKKEGKLDEAFSTFQRVSLLSAASVEARVSLLGLRKHRPFEISIEGLAKLRSEIENLGRHDLMAELTLYQARTAAEAGKLQEAVSYYRNVREKAKSTELLATAREEMSLLQKKHPGLFFPEKAPSLIEEANLLIREGEYIAALGSIQTAKENQPEDNSAYFELLSVEERVLRKLKRHTEADHLLLLISAGESDELAAKAFLKIAKNAWNINDHHRALEFLDKLGSRFPESNLLPDASYIRGRILEELGNFIEANDVYQRLAAKDIPEELKLRTLRRIAWLYYRSDNFLEASKHFQQMASEVTEGNEHYHALYWRAKSLEQVDPTVWEEQKTPASSPENILRKVARGDSFGYYGLIARQDLGIKSMAPKSMPSQTIKCSGGVPTDLSERLSTASDPLLAEILRQEVQWHYTLKSIPPTKMLEMLRGELSAEQVPTILGYIEALMAFHNSKFGIPLAERLLRRMPELKDYGLRCKELVYDLSYPLPYKKLYSNAAEKNNVSRTLLYAITRTESHFNPQATSVTGAKGLMQLMPATAKQEGLEAGQDVTDPNLNIALGSKHLAGLLRSYQGKSPYAIAAYNAGSGAVNRWLSRHKDLSPREWTELIGYPETYSYVKKVSVAEASYLALESQSLERQKQE